MNCWPYREPRQRADGEFARGGRERMENRTLRDVGGTPGGIGEFIIGFVMACVGGYRELRACDCRSMSSSFRLQL
jgi:hypothetical protein